MVADTMSRPPPWLQLAAPSPSTPAGPASAVTDIKVPSGLSVAALSACTVPSPSSRPASAAADVKGPSGFSAAALSVGSRVSSSSPSLVAVVHATAGDALDWAAIAAAQLGCPEISNLQQSSGLQLKALPLGGQHILCDISTSVVRPIIPLTTAEAFSQPCITLLIQGQGRPAASSPADLCGSP